MFNGCVIPEKEKWGGFGTHASFAVSGCVHIFVGFIDQHDEMLSEEAVGCLYQLKYQREMKDQAPRFLTRVFASKRFPSAEPHHGAI